MKILVTGGGGFLGSYIVRDLLKAGHRVIAFQRSRPDGLAGDGVDVVQGSILSPDDLRSAMSGCDAVVHTAAKAGVWGPRREYFATNVDGTNNILNVMKELGIRRLVYSSSPSVVFNGQAFNGEDESLPYGRGWLCDYAESKAMAESLALEWGRSGTGEVIALRPHLIWGIGDPHLLPPVIQRSKSGRLRIVGTGTNRVDTTRVENASRAHVLALEALERPSAVNRAYFISQGEPVELWPWVNSLLAALGIPPLEKKIPFGVAYQVGRICEWIWLLGRRHSIPPMTRFVATELSKSHWFSIEAARKELGYRPEEFPTAEGIAAYVQAWKSGTTPRD